MSKILLKISNYIKNGKSDAEYLLLYMPVGKENAVSREYLSTVTGMSDRRVRNAIHEARREVLIVNLSGGKGYYIADMTKENERLELLQYFRQEESRLKSIGWALKPVRNELKKWGLIT